MLAFYETIAARLARDGRVAVATVIERRGSVPREVGAKMLVSPLGETAGSVGGGCGEALVKREALEVLRSGRPTITRVDLTEPITDQSETNCGGIMEVFVEPLALDDASPGGGMAPRLLLERLERARVARQPAVLCTVVGGEAAPVGTRVLALAGGERAGPDVRWARGLEGAIADALATGRSRRLRMLGEASLDVFVESLPPAPDLVIVGAGHIAQPLAAIGKALGYEVTVIDDRADFASPARFPQADRVLAGDLVETVSRHPVGPGTCLVLVTRGHHLDERVLRAVIERPADYVGMIGSRRRVGAVFDHLRRAGVPEAAIARVHAPIGLDIGADTPGEIALAIAAEIVNLKRGGRAPSLSSRARPSGGPADRR
jgi:xanthine dehydrogenase accessory factor